MFSRTPSGSTVRCQSTVQTTADETTTTHTIQDEETVCQTQTQSTVSGFENTKCQWDSVSDPDNPKNWPMSKRAINAIIIASVGLLSSFASSILVPAVPDVMRQFGVANPLLGTLTTSVYVLGLGFGPFLLAPLSELYGRWIVYATTLAVFTFLQMGCALSTSMTGLIVLRFFAGLTGGMAPSLGQASMSDLWDVHNRGRWAAVLTLGPMLGPPVGNLIAALILQRMHWSWIFWILMILSGALLMLTLFVLQETYEPVILRKRQHKRGLALETDVEKNKECFAEVPMSEKEAEALPDPTRVFGRAVTRPMRFLATSPILGIFGFFLAYTYGMLYLLLTSLPLLFGEAQSHPELFNYGFDNIGTGLSYLGLIIGFFLGCIAQVYSQTHIWNFLTKRNGESRPEYRLLPMTAGMLFFPISLFWYGWSASRRDAWIVPEIATGIFGFGMFITFQSIQVYLMEAFIPYSASALAAATLMRAITGAVFPLFGQQLFVRLGYGKGGTLLAVLALPAIPLPWLLYKKGRYLRQRWAFTP
ncbi:MFS general substrate transporter [Ramaria rubella]|nr:MFS general substrate transporter [Ramaria rubella]